MHDFLKDKTIVVVLSMYRHEEFVRQAIESTFNQVYPYPENVHIVISDDGSPDKSYEIAKSLVDEYTGKFKVTLRRNETNLACEQVNFLYREFPADYYLLYADDDIHYPERMLRTMEAFAKTQALVVTTNARLIDSDGTPISLRVNPANVPRPTLESFLKYGLIPTCFGAGMAYARKVMDVFGPLPENIRNADIIIPFRAAVMLPEGGNAFILPPMLDWRRHEKMSTLGAVERMGDDPVRQILEKERTYCNIVHNWMHILATWERYKSISGHGIEAHREQILKRIFNMVNLWTQLRAEMARDNIGIA